MCSKQLKLYVEVAEKQNAHKIVIEFEIKKGSDEVKRVKADDAAAALTAQGTSYRAGG